MYVVEIEKCLNKYWVQCADILKHRTTSLWQTIKLAKKVNLIAVPSFKTILYLSAADFKC